MRLLELFRLPFIGIKRRYCRHDWAPSRSQAGGWVCVRCGERETPRQQAGGRSS
jgi:hypothetical protein